MWTRTKCCGRLFPCIVILYKLSLLKRNRHFKLRGRKLQNRPNNHRKLLEEKYMGKMFKKGLPFLCEIIALS